MPITRRSWKLSIMAKPAFGSEGASVFERFLKIVAVFDEFGALREHGLVLFFAVAVGNDDDGRRPSEAGGQGYALPVIAAGGGDHAGQVRLRLLEPMHVDQCAANLECAEGRVIFMLYPGFAAQPLVDERPRVLRRGGHVAVDDGLCFMDLGRCVGASWIQHSGEARMAGYNRQESSP